MMNCSKATGTRMLSSILLVALMVWLIVPVIKAQAVGPGDVDGGAGGGLQVAGCTTQAVAAVGGAIATVTTGLPTSDVGAKTGILATAGGTILTCVGTALNLVQNTLTAGGISFLVSKSKLDAIATGLLKKAINLVRDMVIRWIITGRFEGPVFVASFSVDLAKVAENASRIFLSELTDINFCKSIRPPDRQTFRLSADFGLSCTLPDKYDQEYTDTIITLATNPRALQREVIQALGEPNNISTDVTIVALDEQQKAISRALLARSAEYVTGDGFLGIRDADGNIKTPGSYVAELVMQSQIVSPIRQTDVADTVQTAIAAILDTAIRASIEKGLSTAFSP